MRIKTHEISNGVKLPAWAKIILSLLIVTSLGANGFIFTPANAAVGLLIGDTNKNGSIDIGDAMFIGQYLAGKRTFDQDQLKAADVNSDGQIAIDDAKTIQLYLAGKIKFLPVGNLTVNKFSGYGDQTVAAGANGVRLASFVVGAGAAEGVKVNSIGISFSPATSTAITRLYLKDYATGVLLGSTAGNVSTSTATAYAFNVSLSLPASGGKVIDLYGDVKSGTPASRLQASVSAGGAGVISGAACYSDIKAMQIISIRPGALVVNNGAQPVPAILLGGSTGNYMAQYTFSALYEGFTIDQLKLKVPNNFATSTALITVKYTDKAGAVRQSSSVLVTGAEPNATATFTGLNIYVPANSSANLDVYVDLASIADGATSGAAGAITLDNNEGFSATGDSGAWLNKVGLYDLTGNTFYVRKSKPTFVKQALSGAPSTGNDLFKFTVKADNSGNIEIKQLGFTVTTNGMDVASLYLYDFNSGTQLTDTTVSPTGAGGSGSVKLVVGRAAGAAGDGSDDDLLTIGSADSPVKTYSVRGTITNYTAANSDSMTIKFAQDTTATSTVSAATAIAQNNFNVWSDRSASAHTTATAEWTNGFLLKDMTGAQTF